VVRPSSRCAYVVLCQPIFCPKIRPMLAYIVPILGSKMAKIEHSYSETLILTLLLEPMTIMTSLFSDGVLFATDRQCEIIRAIYWEVPSLLSLPKSASHSFQSCEYQGTHLKTHTTHQKSTTAVFTWRAWAQFRTDCIHNWNISYSDNNQSIHLFGLRSKLP
jgi:hypothetical protein